MFNAHLLTFTFLVCQNKIPGMLNSSPHSILVKRQIIKLRLNPGSSALDLNDPIVKSEILKKVSPEFKWFLFSA